MTWDLIWDWVAPWVPAIRTGFVLTLIGAVFGPLYKTWVEKGVQNKFDQQIERLRSQLRQDEEISKANLRRVDEQINALRSTVLSSMSNRQAAFDKRRAEAVDKLWANVTELRPLKSLLSFTQILKMDEVLKLASMKDGDGEAMRKFLTTIWEMHDLDRFKIFKPADTERPFLSPLTWATYVVYHQVVFFPLMQISLGRIAAGVDAMKDPSELVKTVSQTLPNQKKFIEQYGTSSFPYIIEDLEQLLLDQTMMIVNGQDADRQSIEQAKSIIASISPQADFADQELNAIVPDAVRRE